MNWDVVPLCKAQLQDVNQSDILNEGLYRKCNTYKGGGGYDKFPDIFNKRFGCNRTDLHNQFVVQVKGCPLHCPYCYVTDAGVNGKSVQVSSKKMANDFRSSGCSVFHLMGGAPALYLEKWPDLQKELNGAIFHSDFLCLEGEYDESVLSELSQYENSLYAISIKGYTEEEFERNTATKYNKALFERNLERLAKVGLYCYFTFTGMTPENIQKFKDEHKGYYFDDSFAIDIIHYNAIDYKE